jgi:ribonuclease Z
LDQLALIPFKTAVHQGNSDDTPIIAERRDRSGCHPVVLTLGELKAGVFAIVQGEKIGYVTDLRYTPENVATWQALLDGCDVLFIESVFLHEHADHALRKNHLTARRAGLIARQVGARVVVPFHFSPRYADRAHAIVAELEAERLGTRSAGGVGREWG